MRWNVLLLLVLFVSALAAPVALAQSSDNPPLVVTVPVITATAQPAPPAADDDQMARLAQRAETALEQADRSLELTNTVLAQVQAVTSLVGFIALIVGGLGGLFTIWYNGTLRTRVMAAETTAATLSAQVKEFTNARDEIKRELEDLNRLRDIIHTDVLRQGVRLDGLDDRVRATEGQTNEQVLLLSKTRDSLAERIDGEIRQMTLLQDALDQKLNAGIVKLQSTLSYMPLAESFYHAQNLESATRIYQHALRFNEDNPLLNYRIGYIMTQQGALEEADRYLTRANTILPDFPPILAALGYLRRRQGERSKLRDNDEKTWRRLADDADDYLTRALRSERNLLDEDGEAWLCTLAGLQRRLDKPRTAIETYDEATKITPLSSYPHVCIALLYADLDEPAMMLDAYAAALWRAEYEIARNPLNYWGHLNHLVCVLAVKTPLDDMHAQAAGIYERLRLVIPAQAIYAYPTLRETLLRLKRALYILDDSARAAHVEHFIDLLPGA